MTTVVEAFWACPIGKARHGWAPEASTLVLSDHPFMGARRFVMEEFSGREYARLGAWFHTSQGPQFVTSAQIAMIERAGIGPLEIGQTYWVAMR